MIAASASIFAEVATFWMAAERRTETTFTTVTKTIATVATMRVLVELSDTNAPEYSANTVAMVAQADGVMTTRYVHPYAKAVAGPKLSRR